MLEATSATAVYVAIFFVALWYLVLRPRHGGKQAPPLVTQSTVFTKVPLIGHICEFFASPNTMVKRCYQDYGSIFTIPVRYHTYDESV